MSCALPPPGGSGHRDVGLLTRLRHTPLRDLLRGRLTGRLDWERALESSGLPPSAQVRVALTVRATKLWRLEKAQVCDELVAHFVDGLDAGESAEELARNFGDPRRTAKLIRSAKKKLRPLWWHGLKWTTRGVVALMVIYAGLTAYYLNDKVTLKTDYLAQLNAATLATPESERAWPMYREGMLGWKELWEECRYDDAQKPLDISAAFFLVNQPATAEEDPARRLAAWTLIRENLAKHRGQLDLFRQAANRPHMGFVIHMGVGKDDFPLCGTPEGTPYESPRPYKTGVFSPEDAGYSLLGALAPHVGWMGSRVIQPLCADMEISATQGEAAAVVADAKALWNVSTQFREGPWLFEQLAGLSLVSRTDQLLGRIIVSPQGPALDAHTLERLAGEARKIQILPPRLAAEKLMAEDLLQRCYTDDGQGNGHLAFGTTQFIYGLSGGKRNRLDERLASALVSTAASTLTASRQEEQRLIDAHYASLEEEMQTSPLLIVQSIHRQIRPAQLNDPVWQFRHPLAKAILPFFGGVRLAAARTQTTHSALELGIALHRHKLAHGAFPAQLADLVPAYLKELPADPITGDALHYRMDTKGKPIIWSVGANRVDDGGFAPVDRNGEADNREAQNWPTPEEAKYAEPGDWILWPMSDLPVMPAK